MYILLLSPIQNLVVLKAWNVILVERQIVRKESSLFLVMISHQR